MPVLPALAFDSPWLLAGLIAAAVPILIHLFFRRPHREIPWAATRFLLSATKKHAPRIRLEQLLLLALRVILLILVVLALAKPDAGRPRAFLDSDDGRPAGRQIILVLDASYSMAHQVDGETRFDRAQAALRAVLDAARPGDAFQLVRMTDLGQRVVIGEPSFQADLVADTLQEQEISYGRAAPLETLREIETLLAQGRSGQPVEIIVASDFQHVDWQYADAPREELQRLLDAIRERAAISLADAAIAPHDNQALTSFKSERSLVRTGQPARFSATIVQHGANPSGDNRLELLVDGIPTVAETFSLAPNQQTTVAFQDTLTEPGPHALELRLSDDGLKIDNSRFLSVTAADRLRVLLVDGVSGRRAEQSGTFFLERALAPGDSNSANSESDFAPTVISDAELATAELGAYDAVVLANVELITEREVARLRAFASAGGGVVIALGDRVQADIYNRALTGKNGLLPVRFEEIIGRPDNPDRAIAFSTASLEHPIAQPFAGNPGTGLESDFVLAYLKTTFDPASPVQKALEFTTGDPAILTAPLGAGRVVLITTSVDLSWAGPWPQIGRSYLPLMHEILRYAATGLPQTRQLRVGETLLWRIPDRLAGLTATITGPEKLSTTVPLTVAPDGAQARFEETWLPGMYTVSVGAPINQEALFAVNVDPAESNLRPLSPEERQSLIPGSKPLRIDAASGQPLPPAQEWPLSRWLVALAIAALLAEQVMAWRFRRGIVLLGAIWGAFVAYALWQIQPVFGIAVLGVVVLSIVGWWLWSRQASRSA